MKRAAALVLLILFLFMTTASAGENLLSNGSFETLTSAGEPADWYANAYRNQEGYSRITLSSEKAHSGQYSAMVENASSNDARYICTVRVQPETMYRLSGYVLVESMQDTGNGANFGIENIYAFSECLFSTDGEWRYLEWYGETGERQTELTIGVRVGGYSAESVGKAYFDDIVLEKVDSLPTGVVADIWYPVAQAAPVKTEVTEKNTIWFIALAAAFVLLVWLLLPALNVKNVKAEKLLLALILFFGFVLRVILAMNVEGYEVDINCFTAWSARMAQLGPAGFYSPDYFCDYPPGAMLLLWPVGGLLKLTGYGTAWSLLAVKLLPILCDLFGAGVLYAFARKRSDSLMPVVLAAIYLLNPAVLVNGAAWGQVDAVLALCMLLTTCAALERSWRKAIPLFAVSALVKPQALLFAPIGGMWLLFGLFRKQIDSKTRKKEGRDLLFGVLYALAAVLVIVVPFSVRQEKPFTWLFELYGETLSSYAYATLNTANLYYVIGANWTPLTQQVPTWLSVVTSCLFSAAGVAVLIGRRDKTRAALFGVAAVVHAVLAIVGVEYALYGYAMMALVYAFAILCLYSDRNAGALPYAMAIALIGVYVLGVKVHERYLFPALILLLMSYVTSRDRRVLGLFTAFSVSTFVNTAIVLDNSILFGAAQGHLNADTQGLNLLLCAVNLFLCLYAGWIGITGLRASKTQTAAPVQPKGAPESYAKMLLEPVDCRLHMTLRDWLIVSITTVAYAVLAFSNLGSTVAPQTAWVSTSADEEVVFELDEPTTFSLMYYGGVSYNDFAISVSEDGVQWSDPVPCQMREGLCYRWLYAVRPTESGFTDQKPQNVLHLNGKFLRIHAESAGLNLWEIVARDEAGNMLPLKLVSHDGANEDLLASNQPASNLIDEQNTWSGEPGWFNGTYFDEIYHARTGYEHLHGQRPYETTHPPLGKLLMSAGIAVFGMTPFGWRFEGALIGVLMLPALYLLALQLTHRKSIAAVSMIALALDLMHYTQTRIATIDSFPVLFILLSSLFMVRYMQTDVFDASDAKAPRLWDRPFRRSLLPLLFSGIFMGLSIASKWIGIYSAVGLAALFFLTVYRQWRASYVSFDIEDDSASARLWVAQNFTLKRILITCGFCVLFFIVIPCVIYYLCYIPYLAPSGPVTIRRVISAQEGMLSYHSTPGLGMDHPFQSPWWQWPFILKPMWFAQDSFEPAGYASTIMCMGNPWIFYIGAFAMLGVLAAFVLKYIGIRGGRMAVKRGNGNLVLAVLSIGFLAQYLPWVLVPRSMYMYHYFASVPFIIMATAWFLDQIRDANIRHIVMAVYLIGSLVFFILFFPYASGWLTSTEWLDAMKWFSRLYY